jgi:uncharacterized protein with HEPN domain
VVAAREFVNERNATMSVARLYLYEIWRLAEKLIREFGSLSYEKFAQDANRIESAVMSLVIMREGWSWLPVKMREELVPIEWSAVTGKWNLEAARHVGVDSKQLWETIVQGLPELSRKAEELLKRQIE